MKALEDAIAATSTADRLRILKTVPPKEYPKLLKAIVETRQLFGSEMYATNQAGEDEREAMVEAVHRKIDCLDLAEMMASMAKKKLSKHPRDELLLAEETITLLTGNPPVWLSQLIHGYSGNVILRYSKTGSIQPPPEGDLYYDLLPQHIFIQCEGLTDRIKRFLLDNPVILESHLHVCIRQMARKRSWNRFNLRMSYEVAGNGERRLMYPNTAFPLMTVIGLLFSEGNFPIQPVLRTIIETLADVQREFEARNILEVHNQLAPTPEQCLKLQHDYFTLLSSPHNAVARFAIDTVAGFVGIEGFDAKAFVPYSDAIFTHASNSLQVAGLKLVREVAKQHPKCGSQIPEKIAAALLNPDPKVQAGILAVLQALTPAAQKAIPAALSPFADKIIPSLRVSFQKWLGKVPVSSIPDIEQCSVLLPVIGDRLVPLRSVDELPFIANELLSGKADPMRLELFLD